MFNVFDLMRQAQGGAGFDNMARQFGLSPDQVQRAVAAVLPAFMMGFQRNAANPAAMMNLFQTMVGGNYPTFFESAAQAFSAQGRREGEALLDQLFGSDEVSRRVAQQAAQFSGVGTEVLNQILPLTAAILAGGIAKALSAQGAMLGPMAEAWRSGMTGQGSGGTPIGTWTDAWQQWMGAMSPAEQPKAAPRGKARAEPDESVLFNPFAAVMAGLMNASMPQRPAPEPEPEPEPEATPASPADAWSRMMETGRDMQTQHIAALQGIFESVWGRAGAAPEGKPGKSSGSKKRK
jgi:hypothetical protein